MEPKFRKGKGEVTGKITEVKKTSAGVPASQPESMEYEKEQTTGLTKGEMAKNYRDILQAQVDAKKAAEAHEKELRRGGTGFEVESMYKEAQKEQEMAGKTKEEGKERINAKEIQHYNQLLAQQKAYEKSAQKGHEVYEPTSEPPREVDLLAKAMPQGELETDVKAQKKEMATKLKEALETQIAEDKARKLQEKQDRMGYKKQQILIEGE
eukprot:TRINITY_DN88989_c0_g1_i1.p1 TRINITY_DN88989_c0_g1~~TRINITY_DN88989_c0_g1_i1.p1  ORF type:complete len:210 (+),score=58.08 TRINITY_DN88989_c0_g1_i1:192-821(+)